MTTLAITLPIAQTTVIEEDEEEAEGGAKEAPGIDEVQDIPDEDVTIVKKRFSAEGNGADKNHQDAMGAVDMGISEKSDKIAQKVMEIQRKVSSELFSLWDAG
jgi:nicotinamide N-methyltransferase